MGTIKTNDSGYVDFANRSFRYQGDRGTWARIKDGKLTVKIAGKGTISSAYTDEMRLFCSDYGIDFDAMRCGDTITVDI